MHAMWTALAALMVTAWAPANEPPVNVVMILADDLGWTDLGCQGSRYYETPHIDGMAQAGMRFTAAYTCGPNCQPTRAAIMTGQYGPRTGVYTVGGTDRFDTSRRPLVPVENVVQLPLGKITLADSMTRAGRATGLFGKWHLGTGAHAPDRRGFAETLVSMGRHFDFETAPPVDVPKGTYLADYLTDRALDFIDRHKRQPFFLYLPHFGVHSPHQAKPELVARFKTKPPANGHHNPVYAAMIASVDESVGRVLRKLAELGLDRNTLVIFTSDNGGVGGYREAGIDTKQGITNNAPLRGGKGMLYEGGIRVPLIATWPSKIAPGTVCDEPIASIDFHPTLLELVKAPPIDQSLDGKSLLPLLLSNGARKLERDALFWHFPGYLGAGGDAWRTTPAGAIRMGDFKLQEFFEDGHVELYNLRTDIGERQDLAKTMSDKANEMLGRLRRWRKEIQAPMPTKRDPAAKPTKKAGKKQRTRKKGDDQAL